MGHTTILVFILPQCVASEYATRYLEQLGVRASKSALDLVNQHIPLTEKCIKTTIRVRRKLGQQACA